MQIGLTAEQMLCKFRDEMAAKVKGTDSWAPVFSRLPEANQIELLGMLDEADECTLAVAAMDVAIERLAALKLEPMRDELRQHRG